MQILKKILYFVVGLIVLLVVVSLFLPAHIHVERTALVKGSPETVYKLVTHLPSWERWSPWHRIDPQMKVEYATISEGLGAQYSWKSENDRVGNGSIKIVDLKPASYVKTEMNFMENGIATSEYFLAPTPEGTQVKWTMDSEAGWNPMMRYMGLMMDKWVGPDYEKGLHYLDSVAQIAPVASEEAFKIDLEMGTMPAQKLLLMKGSAKEAEIGKALGEIYGQIGKVVKENGLKMAGAPMALYDDPQGGTYTFEAGIPVDKKPSKPLPANIMYREMDESAAAIAHFSGPYEKTGAAYPALQELMAEKGKSIAGKPMESYISDPMEAKTPFDIKTDIYWPVK